LETLIRASIESCLGSSERLAAPLFAGAPNRKASLKHRGAKTGWLAIVRHIAGPLHAIDLAQKRHRISPKNEPRGRMSLRLKIIAGIGVILVAVIAVYAAISVSRQAEHVRLLAQREATLIASLAERAIASAMLEGKSDEVEAILRKIGEQPGLVRIEIVDPEGVVLRSALPEDATKRLPPVGGRIGGVSPPPYWDDQSNTVDILRPIVNAQPCHRCHSLERPVVGFVHASFSFAEVAPQVEPSLTEAILPAALAVAAASALIGLYFSFAVGRRIERLSDAMKQVEAGDLQARVRDRTPDELGRLANSFDGMVSRLAGAKQQLEDRHSDEVRRAEHLAAVGKLAAGVAHEINNPLAGMQNCVRTLSKWAGTDQRQTQYLQMLQEGLSRIARTVRQLLDFARESPPRMTRVDLGSLLDRCLRLLAHELAERKIACAPFPSGELPDICADPQQLEQVFVNLLMNALDAMTGGGTLTVSAAVREEGSRLLEVMVADTGAGIPAQDLPRIFDPFFTTKQVGKGTGLGLSVSYGIIKAHGGSIEVESEPGKGSTFKVLLPVAQRNDGP
jgi:signal transduction histidine kinase